MCNALLIDGRDNVAVVIEPIARGSAVTWVSGGRTQQLTALDAIPPYHKIAVRPMEPGAPVIKYGEVIGTAACAIEAGRHVHTHNVADLPRRKEV